MMDDSKTVLSQWLSSPLVVIPTFNEAPRVLEDTVRGVLGGGYRVLVIDDGSASAALAGFQHEHLVVLRHITNLGQGAALQTAFQYATMRDEALVVTFDADGQHDVSDIQKVIEPILKGRADIVLGSRFLTVGSAAKIPWQRRLLLRAGVVFNALVCGLFMTDAHNGLRALNSHTLRTLHIRENRMAHATDLIRQVKQCGLRWEEVPVNIAYTAYSMQKGNTGLRVLQIIRDILARRLFPDTQAVPTATYLCCFFVLFSSGLLLQPYRWGLLFVEAALVAVFIMGIYIYREKRQKLIDKTMRVRLLALHPSSTSAVP